MTFRESMNDVLTSRRYSHLQDESGGLRETITNWLDEQLRRLSETPIEVRETNRTPIDIDISSSVLPWIFGTIGILLLVAAVAFVIYKIVIARKRRVISLEEIFEEVKDLTAMDLIYKSDATQDRRLAVRYRYIAVLLRLTERHTINIRPSFTNAVILQQLPPGLKPSFKVVADTFHLVWFGYKNISDSRYQEFVNSVSTLINGGASNA